MKECHVCKTECEDNAELCPLCGADLFAEEISNGEAAEEKEIIIKNPVLAASVDDVVTAEIFKDILTDNGIPFTCDSLEEGTLKVNFGGSFTADDIYVDETDLEKANELYEQVLNSEPQFDEDFFVEDIEDGGEE